MPNVSWPAEFDPTFYIAQYPDLRSMSPDMARAHFEEFGRTEGRVASPAASREGFLSLVPADASVLEIGPGHTPAFRGRNVMYFDVVDTEGLQHRAIQWNQSPQGVPGRIDFVSPKSDMSAVPTKHFDFVFSSHAIEHQPDLISHLQQVARVLRPGGVYLVICPDRRFCFDRHIRPTTIGDVIEAFSDRRDRHRLADVIDAHVLPVHNDPQRHWRERAPEPDLDPVLLKKALLAWESEDYVDVHAWRLEPSAARKILSLLHGAGYIPLVPARIYDTPRDRGEFCMVLAVP